MEKNIRIALIPAYEPTDLLIGLVMELYNEAFKIVVIDDGSSASRSSIFDAVVPYAVVIRHSQNKGKGEALKTGLRYIRENVKEDCVIVTMDADGQHCIKDVLNCCQAAQQHPDSLILGCRQFSGDVPLKSMLGNKITRFVCHFFAGLDVTDTQTGLRAFPSSMIQFMTAIDGERYEYEMNVLLECSENHIPMREVGIETVYIDGNSSSHFNPWKDSFRIYRRILKFAASSIIGFAVDYGLFALLSLITSGLGTGFSLTFSNITARICSCSVNYTLNRKLVFKSTNGVAKSAAQYFLLASCIMLLNTIVLNIFVSILGLNPYLAKILVELIFFSLSWFVQQRFIFRQTAQCSKSHGEADK